MSTRADTSQGKHNKCARELRHPKEMIRNEDIYLIPKSGKYDSVLVWMHGLGDSAKGFYPIFKGYKLLGNAKVVLLTAPKRAVTLNFGMVMTSWFDIKSLEATDEKGFSQEQFRESAERIKKVLDEESK